jgi:uroporphyrinogen III methyltransferase/synthase
MASAVAFVTGHEDPEKPETAVNWAALAAFPGTLVFYMGVRQLPRIAEQLIAHGRDPDEPAAVVERGTFADQRTLLSETRHARRAGRPRARDHRRRSCGRAADELAWRDHGPLVGAASR